MAFLTAWVRCSLCAPPILTPGSSLACANPRLKKEHTWSLDRGAALAPPPHNHPF